MLRQQNTRTNLEVQAATMRSRTHSKRRITRREALAAAGAVAMGLSQRKLVLAQLQRRNETNLHGILSRMTQADKVGQLLMAYLDAIGKQIKYCETYKTGLKWIHSFGDMRAAMTMFQNGELGLSEWLYSIRNVTDYPYFNAKDLLPFLSNPFFAGPVYVKELLRKLSILEKPLK